MMIIGCDYHPGFQQIAFVDTDTGGDVSPTILAYYRKPLKQFTQGDWQRQNETNGVPALRVGHISCHLAGLLY